jgi:hypothetical protein
MAYKLAFGTLVFPSTLRPNEGPTEWDLGEQERPRADGSVVQPARKRSRLLSIRGEVTAPDADTLYTTLETIRGACSQGTQPLWYGRDDRVINAQCERYTEDYEDGRLYGLMASVALEFRAPDPYFSALAPTLAALTPSGGTVVNPGDATALPAVTLILGGAGAGVVTLANATTGQSCAHSGTFASGDVIVLTRDGYGVALNGVAAFGLFAGVMPVLASGANALTVGASGVPLASVSVSFTARYG